MAITLEILGWKTYGLRCPDHEISLKKSEGDEVFPITLIQMPNGTGKTTVLKLIRGCLSGQARDWNPQRISTFRKDSTISDGRFELRVRFNEKYVTFDMTFDFFSNTLQFRTSKSSSRGMESGYNPPWEIRSFLTKAQLVNLFVFDGELANDLLDSHKTKAQEAVDGLFNLNLFQAIPESARAYYKEELFEKNNSHSLKLKISSLNNAKDTLVQRKIEEKQLQEDIRAVEGKILKIKADIEIGRKNSGHDEKARKLAETEMRAAEAALREVSRELISKIKSPMELSCLFAEKLLGFKNSLDRVKLPETAAKEFFMELAEGNECVCGRPIDACVRDAIKKQAAKYLGGESVGLLNKIKQDIAADQAALNGANQDQQIAAIIERMKEAIDAYWKKKNALEVIEAAILKGDPDMQQNQNLLTENMQRQVRLREELGEYHKSEPSVGNPTTWKSIEKLAEFIRKQEHEVAESTKTLEKQRKLELFEKIMCAAHKKARKNIIGRLVEKTNEAISGILPDNNIKLEGIENSLVLDRESGSVGETLSVSYAFISTLLGSYTNKLPFIVDSPANSIDNEVRKEIAGLMPRLSHQLVAFVMSSEKDHFVGPLERAAGETINYVTLFRNKADKKLKPYIDALPKYTGVIRTPNGITVHDKKFFHEFHITETNKI